MNFKNIFKNDLFVFFLFLIIIYAIFRYSESFDKGFNIIEDQLIVNTDKSLESGSFVSVFEQEVKNDVIWLKRFRPLWVFYVLTTVKLFGVNFLLINIYIAFLCICTSFLLFKFCSNSGFTSLQSFLFALLTIIGPATILWARPPDAEIIGMLMLSLSLYFLSKCICSNNYQVLYKSFFIISLLLTSLCKESFLISIPSVLFLYIWFYSSKNNLSFLQSMKKNYSTIILITVLFFGVLYSIITFVSIDSEQSYSGVDIKLFSQKTMLDFFNTVMKSNLFLLILFGIFILAENGLANNKLSIKYLKNNFNKLFLIIIFLLSFVLPQLILYYKTGFIGGRYYLPYLMGFSFTLIYLLKVISENKSISFFIKKLYASTIVVFLIFELITVTIPTLSEFSVLCKSNTEVIYSIAKNPNNELLIVMDPVQNYYQIYPIQVFLDLLNGKKELKVDFIKLNYTNIIYTDTSFYNTAASLSKKVLGNKQIDSLKDNTGIGNIIIYNGLYKKFIDKNKSWFKESSYEKKHLGYFTLYLKH